MNNVFFRHIFSQAYTASSAIFKCCMSSEVGVKKQAGNYRQPLLTTKRGVVGWVGPIVHCYK
jgi:hypothetical protein